MKDEILKPSSRNVLALPSRIQFRKVLVNLVAERLVITQQQELIHF